MFCKLSIYDQRPPERVKYQADETAACDALLYEVPYAGESVASAFTFVVSCYGPIDEVPRFGIENLKIPQTSPDGKREEVWFSQSDPWAREEELESLLEEAPDLYDGFALGAMTAARLEGTVSQTCDFILANPDATTSDILECQLSLSAPQYIEVERGEDPRCVWSSHLGNIPPAA